MPAEGEVDELSGIEGWRLHDLRRTFASGMQELGVDFWIVEALLNHQLPGLGSVYMRAELHAAKTSALRLWAAEVQRITGAKKKPPRSRLRPSIEGGGLSLLKMRR